MSFIDPSSSELKKVFSLYDYSAEPRNLIKQEILLTEWREARLFKLATNFIIRSISTYSYESNELPPTRTNLYRREDQEYIECCYDEKKRHHNSISWLEVNFYLIVALHQYYSEIHRVKGSKFKRQLLRTLLWNAPKRLCKIDFHVMVYAFF